MTAKKPHSEAQETLSLQREKEVMERRIRHEQFRDIAESMGISLGGAHKAFQRAKARLLDDVVLAADEWRTVMLEGYERDLLAINEAVAAGRLALDVAVARRNQIRDGMRELLGLDAPTRFTSDSKVEVVITGGEGV